MPKVAIIGAGLAGCLQAVYLRQRGFEVDVYEKRNDMRNAEAEKGRSINLVVTNRGLNALNKVGLHVKYMGGSGNVSSYNIIPVDPKDDRYIEPESEPESLDFKIFIILVCFQAFSDPATPRKG